MSQGQRRLAAIMFTDMVGFTALGQKNESLSLALVDEQRNLIRPILGRHGGKEIKTIGDGFMVEFASALDAARCAYDIQRAVREFNFSIPDDRRIQLRIGVHLGDVIESGGDISGDAVNLASRMVPLADGGGVCLSRQVFDNIQNKIQLQLVSLGPKNLKNVSAPVEMFKMVMPWETERNDRPVQLDPRRIAVLPFVSMSPDPNDEYFADGLTEELISKLSQVGGLKVIARTSVMNYKKKEKNASVIGSELGAGTLVEGSVRKAGERIRVSVQVIDSATQVHRWSTNYDRNLDDIFTVQTDIASKVTESLPGSLPRGISSSTEGDTQSVAAYTAYMQAMRLVKESETLPGIRNALELFKKSVEVDPSFARGWVGVASCYPRLHRFSVMSHREWRGLADEALQKAFDISPDLPEAHALRGQFAWFDDDFVTAEAEDRRAIDLNPNLAESYESLAFLRASMGDGLETIKLLEKARELDPLSPMVCFLGEMYYYKGEKDLALDIWRKAEGFHQIDVCEHLFEYELAEGRPQKAAEYLEKLEKLSPGQVGVLGDRGVLAALSGDKAKALKIIDQLKTSFEMTSTMPDHVAYIYYALDDLDGAFEWLGKAVENHSLIPHNIRFSPLFASLRKDARFKQLLVKNGLNPENKPWVTKAEPPT
jgi:adenylate cyclase